MNKWWIVQTGKKKKKKTEKCFFQKSRILLIWDLGEVTLNIYRSQHAWCLPSTVSVLDRDKSCLDRKKPIHSGPHSGAETP